MYTGSVEKSKMKKVHPNFYGLCTVYVHSIAIYMLYFDNSVNGSESHT